MTMTIEEFDALDDDLRQRYLSAAHGAVARLSVYIDEDGDDVVEVTGNQSVTAECIASMRTIRAYAKGVSHTMPMIAVME